MPFPPDPVGTDMRVSMCCVAAPLLYCGNPSETLHKRVVLLAGDGEDHLHERASEMLSICRNENWAVPILSSLKSEKFRKVVAMVCEARARALILEARALPR
jgi:hypothetical protein